MVAVVASVAGTLATVVLWKPAAILGAVIVPVLTALVEQTLGKPARALLSRGGPVDDAEQRATSLRPRRPNLRAAAKIGGLGFVIAAIVLAGVTLVSGQPLKETPTFGGSAIINKPGPESGPGGGSVGGGGPADRDDDGISDADDNCKTVFNPEQHDTNGAGRGDACDEDDDNDGALDADDNCPTIPNSGQENTNGAGRGDACDEDDDNDGALDADDNCPTVPNSGQEDTDGDGRGDACDEDGGNDSDLDGLLDADDNCPTVANSGQEDTDGDGRGDACDEALGADSDSG